MPTPSGGGAGCNGRTFNRGLAGPWSNCAITETPLPDSTAAMRLVILSYSSTICGGRFQWRKQTCNPSVVFRVVRKREGDKTFFGDLFQPDSTRSRQWMRRMHSPRKRADAVTSSKTNPVKTFGGPAPAWRPAAFHQSARATFPAWINREVPPAPRGGFPNHHRGGDAPAAVVLDDLDSLPLAIERPSRAAAHRAEAPPRGYTRGCSSTAAYVRDLVRLARGAQALLRAKRLRESRRRGVGNHNSSIRLRMADRDPPSAPALPARRGPVCRDERRSSVRRRSVRSGPAPCREASGAGCSVPEQHRSGPTPPRRSRRDRPAARPRPAREPPDERAAGRQAGLIVARFASSAAGLLERARSPTTPARRANPARSLTPDASSCLTSPSFARSSVARPQCRGAWRIAVRVQSRRPRGESARWSRSLRLSPRKRLAKRGGKRRGDCPLPIRLAKVATSTRTRAVERVRLPDQTNGCIASSAPRPLDVFALSLGHSTRSVRLEVSAAASIEVGSAATRNGAGQDTSARARRRSTPP